MTTKHDLKQLIRARMAKTGESYVTARRKLMMGASGAPTAVAPTATGPIKGWLMQGATPHAYELVLEPTGGPEGGSCARVRSRDDAALDSASLTQFFLAERYRGARLRLSARIRTERLAAGCGLWMELFENTRMVLFNESTVRDETWVRREVVLDVDDSITLVSFGLTVRGAGTAWLAEVAVERVGEEVPATASRQIPDHPVNLGFTDG